MQKTKAPKEYYECVASEEKSGKSHDDAQRICSISFYKRHKMTPSQWEKRHNKDKADYELIGHDFEDITKFTESAKAELDSPEFLIYFALNLDKIDKKE